MTHHEQNSNPEYLASLRTQFTELNNRSRWYSSNLWQIPFAYFAIFTIVLVQVMKEFPNYFPLVLLSTGFFGVFVIWHMVGVIDGEKRAVQNLKEIENQLNLKQTVAYKPINYIAPLFLALIIGVLVCFGFGFGFYLLKCSLAQ